jgi:hypothetical protein
MIIMYKKRKIEIMIDFELHAPNLLSAFINFKSINYSLKF